jgi:hypothetical protein
LEALPQLPAPRKEMLRSKLMGLIRKPKVKLKLILALKRPDRVIKAVMALCNLV